MSLLKRNGEGNQVDDVAEQVFRSNLKFKFDQNTSDWAILYGGIFYLFLMVEKNQTDKRSLLGIFVGDSLRVEQFIAGLRAEH